MRCIERKVRLSGEEVLFDCELLAITEGYGVLRYVVGESRRIDGLLLPAGTVTLALYFSGRLYNLYYWIAPPAETREIGRPAPHGSASPAREIACYFNIAELLLLSPGEIAYRDLVVDVLVLPDGRTRVLDESELPADLAPAMRRRIEAARDELLAGHARIIAEARAILGPYAEAM